uniref:Aquaporin n=1 Tax=Panagrolaimus sp. PS1159 TaxID=55785 RepID=A0AC35FIA1_9BILA
MSVKEWIKEELKQKPNIFTQALSECFCTCLMVFIGLGTMATAFFKGEGFGVGVQLGWAFAMTISVYMGVRISAQLDPAISFMFFTLGHMSFGRFILYFIAQTFGAFIAAAMIFGIYYG